MVMAGVRKKPNIDTNNALLVVDQMSLQAASQLRTALWWNHHLGVSFLAEENLSGEKIWE